MQPIAPNNPMVPEGAPGALRLPVVEIRPRGTDTPQRPGAGVA